MRLTPMRYKEFTWPHNPEIYTVEYRRQMAAHKVPFGRCVLQDLGYTYRVLKGEGVFTGDDAYRQFQELTAVFQESGPGLLVHPVWQAERAYFVELKVTEEGVSLYLNNELVGKKTLSDNILLFEKALSDITQILSYPDNFKVTEIKKYYGENWETTLCWPLEEREIKVEIEYIDTNDSLWFISGNIEKDKINDTFTPLNIFSTPYFVLNEVKKDGEERNKGLW